MSRVWAAVKTRLKRAALVATVEVLAWVLDHGDALAALAAAGVMFTGRFKLAVILASLTAATLRGSRAIVRRQAAGSSSILSELSSRARSDGVARRVRRRWARAMRVAGLAGKPGEPGAKRGRIRRTRLGIRFHINLSPVGGTVEQLQAKRANLASCWHAVDVRVDEHKPGWARCEVRYVLPLGSPVRLSDLPAGTANRLPIGLDEDDRPVPVDVRLPRMIVGAQGAGKSMEIWATLDRLQAAGVPCRVRVFNPKRIELTALEGIAYDYEEDPLAWPDFLGRAIYGMESRARSMAKQSLTEIHQYSEKWPLDLTIIDELVTALTVGGKVQLGSRIITADNALILFLSQARAAGFTCLAGTQLSDKDIIGPARALFSYASCLRVGTLEEAMVDVVLGRGAAKAYPAHKLSAARADAGIGYVASAKGRVIKYRGALVTPEERAEIVERMRETKPPAKRLSIVKDPEGKESAS